MLSFRDEHTLDAAMIDDDIRVVRSARRQQ